jgi:DNA polymerase-3 subunit epsilon
MGGRQAVLGLAVDARRMTGGQAEAIRARPVPLAPRLDAEDLAAHAAFVATMGDKALWGAYAEPVSNAAE